MASGDIVAIVAILAIAGGAIWCFSPSGPCRNAFGNILTPPAGKVTETSKGGTAGLKLGQNLQAGINSKAQAVNSGLFTQNNNLPVTLA